MSQKGGKNKGNLYKSQGCFYKRIKIDFDLDSLIIPIDWIEVERHEIANFIRNINTRKND